MKVRNQPKLRRVIDLGLLDVFVLLLPGKNKISKTKETAEWTCSVCKIDVHLYASIVCDGCLECARTILNVLASKRHQNPARVKELLLLYFNL
jgi:hypothetical protein